MQICIHGLFYWDMSAIIIENILYVCIIKLIKAHNIKRYKNEAKKQKKYFSDSIAFYSVIMDYDVCPSKK